MQAIFLTVYLFGINISHSCFVKIESCEIRKFDGNNWESFFEESNIKEFST